MNEPEIKRDIKHWPFKVIEKGGKPSVQVNYKGTAHDFVRLLSACVFASQFDPDLVTSIQTPEEISAMVLIKMKETAEAYLGKKVTHAVVTVPACAQSRLLAFVLLTDPFVAHRLQRRSTSGH